MIAVILLGPPGSGKGTVAKALMETGFTHISTGEMLREQIRLGTPAGLEAKERIAQGYFASDALVLDMVQNVIERADPLEKFIFDGFPRTLVQAEAFDTLVERIGLDFSGIIRLDCPDEQLVKRLSGRQTCEQCGAVYHLLNHPSKVAGVCDLEGSKLVTRSDDTVETAWKRLEIYKQQTAPLVNFYRQKGLFYSVDATKSIEEVRYSVLEKLGSKA